MTPSALRSLRSAWSVARQRGWLSVVAAGLCLVAGGCRGVMSQSQGVEGTRLFMSGQFDAAQRKFSEAVATNPNDPDAFYNLAATTHQLGRLRKSTPELAQAELLYNQCLDRNPNHVDCHRGLAVLLVDQGRSEKAFTLLERWVKSAPTLPDARVELARLYDEYGEREAAKQFLNEALTVDPLNARALTALGALHEKQGDYGQAIAVYQRSLASNRFQPEVAQRVAVLQRSGGVANLPLPAPPAQPRVTTGTLPTTIR